MSVINKMLQDLEQRQHPHANTSQKHHAPLPDNGSKIPYLWLALFFVIILFSVLWFSKNSQSQTVSVISDENVATAINDEAEFTPEQSPLSVTDNAEPADIVAALSIEPVKHANPAIPKEIVITTDAVVHAAPVIATPVLQQPTDIGRLQPMVSTTQQPDLATAAKPQATIDKQPLTAAARQQNMQLRANASEAAGDTSTAIVIWQQIVGQQPTDANGYLNLARLWLKQQQIVNASQVLLQARQNGVLSAEINMQLAQLAVRQGQWQQALEFLPDQFELAAEPEYFGFKATVLQQLQQHDAALNWYQRLQQLQPDQGRWSLGAALASEQLGQPLQAHQYYQHAWQHRQALSVSSHNFIQQRLKATEP